MLIKFFHGLKKGTVLPVRYNNGHILVKSEKGIADLSDFVDGQTRINLSHTGKGFAVCVDEEHVSISSYFQFHVHSEYSLLDGISKISDIADKSSGITAVTDHGNMFAALPFQNEMKKRGKKAVFGIEAYAETTEGEKNKNHLILLAKNETGYKNLMRLTSRSYENMHYKPHVYFEDLRKYHEGIICTSACLGGEIAEKIKTDYESAKKSATIFKEIFGEDYYLEIQRHGIKGETDINKNIIRLAKELDIKLVAANDSHYISPEDEKPHEAVLCIRTKKTLLEPHFSFDGNGYHYMTDEEMIKLFWDIPEAITNTIEIAEKCDYVIPTGTYLLPKFPIPDGYKDETDYFLYLVDRGFKERFGDLSDREYLDRLEYEKNIIIQMGFPAYFLIVWDYVNYAKTNGILVGPGRGSAAGSLVSYCLKITDLDPIKYGLLFERFLNPDRISMPDIDMDFEFTRRHEVIDYTKRKYGEDCVCNISTFTSLQARLAIKDCARVCGETELGAKISSLVDPKEGSIKKAIEANPELSALYENDKNTKTVIDLAMRLEKNIRQTSTNACGVVISGEPITEHVATAIMEASNNDDTGEEGKKFLTTQADKNIVEELGLLKMDFLGLRTLSVIKEGVEHANEDRERQGFPKFFNYRDIPCNDPYVYAEISEGNSFAVFQLESPGMRGFMKNLFSDVKERIGSIEEKYHCSGFLDYFRGEESERDSYEKEMGELGDELFERLVAGVSLYRPGPIDYIPDYVSNMNHPDKIEYDVPQLEPVLKGTYGIIVYQEQVMRIVRELAGFTSGQSDTIRKAMGKKKKEILEEYKPYFLYGSGDKIDEHTGKPYGIKGCVANGIPEDKAIALWDKMYSFASYAFNKSHAAVYAVITAECAYLKHYHKVGYMCSYINAYISKPDKTKKSVNLLSKMDIKILTPDINLSHGKFTVENGCIRFGLEGLNGVSKTASYIIEDRNKNGDYSGLQDFANRAIKGKIGKKNIEALIEVGCFDYTGHTRKAMRLALDKVVQIAKNQSKTAPEQLDFFSLELIEGEMTGDDAIVDVPEYPKKQLLMDEFDISGLYLSAHPLDEYEKQIERFGLQDTTSLASKTRVSVCGIIKDFKTRITKKDVRLMANFNIEDKMGEVSCVMFPDTYADFAHLVHENDIVIVSGSYSEDGDFGPQIAVSSVKTVEAVANEYEHKDYSLCVLVKDKQGYERLSEIIKENKGEISICCQMDKHLYRFNGGISGESLVFVMLQDEFGAECVKYVRQPSQKGTAS